MLPLVSRVAFGLQHWVARVNQGIKYSQGTRHQEHPASQVLASLVRMQATVQLGFWHWGLENGLILAKKVGGVWIGVLHGGYLQGQQGSVSYGHQTFSNTLYSHVAAT
jgi:hypothetical protein